MRVERRGTAAALRVASKSIGVSRRPLLHPLCRFSVLSSALRSLEILKRSDSGSSTLPVPSSSTAGTSVNGQGTSSTSLPLSSRFWSPRKRAMAVGLARAHPMSDRKPHPSPESGLNTRSTLVSALSASASSSSWGLTTLPLPLPLPLETLPVGLGLT